MARKWTAEMKRKFAAKMLAARKAKASKFGKKKVAKKVAPKRRSLSASTKPRRVFGRKKVAYIIRANVAERGALVPYYYDGANFNTDKQYAEVFDSHTKALNMAKFILQKVPYKVRSLQIDKK